MYCSLVTVGYSIQWVHVVNDSYEFRKQRFESIRSETLPNANAEGKSNKIFYPDEISRPIKDLAKVAKVIKLCENFPNWVIQATLCAVAHYKSCPEESLYYLHRTMSALPNDGETWLRCWSRFRNQQLFWAAQQIELAYLQKYGVPLLISY